MSFTVERCLSCDAEIIWAMTRNGRRMPVDAEPHRDGDVQLTERRDGLLVQMPLAAVVQVAKRFGKRELRRSHFATCPHAGQWRRPRRRIGGAP